MRGQATLLEFNQATVAELGAVPRRGLIEVGVLCAIFAVCNLLSWRRNLGPEAIAYAIVAALALSAMLTTYSVTMMMAGVGRSLRGFLKFTLTALAMLAPLAVVLVLLVLYARFYKHAVALIPILVLMFGSIWTLAMLPAWPISQAQAGRFVSPLRMIRATAGHRWALFIASCMISALNRAGPDIDKAQNLAEAGAYALVSAVLTGVSIIWGASVGVTAWRLAARQDRGLAG